MGHARTGEVVTMTKKPPTHPFLPGINPLPTAPYVKGSETSRAAAESIRPHVNAQQAEVLRIIRTAGSAGMTDEEIIKTGVASANAVRPRRVELAAKKLIVRVGKRKTTAGRMAQVWVAREHVPVTDEK